MMITMRKVQFCIVFYFLCEVNALFYKKISHQDLTEEDTTNFTDVFIRDLENSIVIAEDQVHKLATFEMNIQTSGLRTERVSPSHGQMVDFLPSDEAINNTKSAFIAIKASQYLTSKHCSRLSVKKKECTEQLSSIKLFGTKLGEVCSDIYKNIKCDANTTKYRNLDGSCNNLKTPFWGRSNTAYRRLLKADYDDGLYALCGTTNGGKELPSARLISTTLAEPTEMLDFSHTQAMAIWGLFIGHDMSYTPASNMVNIKTPITCCTNDGRPLPPRYNHISCAPITIPHTDIFYNKFFQSCMNYVRSLPAMRPECTLGPTEQMNQASHFLDGSVIYGSTEAKAKSLRSMWGGRLITSMQKNGAEYPPLSDRNKIACHLLNNSNCYNAGDMRVNSHPQLSVLHTLFIREHNRIADTLATLNNHWDDELLFQETKKIVIAEIQHITYTQWLPRILGKKYFAHHIKISHLESEDLYNDQVEPTVSNSFATAALPFINSMLDGEIGLYLEDRNVMDITQLKNHFTQQSLLTENTYFDSIVRGLATQSSQKIDTTFSEAVTHYWYSSSGNFGMDLFSLDIQRGRDHGIPSYVNFRKICNLTEPNSFKDLRGIISQGHHSFGESVSKSQ
ncbi:peroxidase-like isoform X2 [Planococcus citri]|uniref:peroxidase-like isoform X2 n=1 Tax=Planococcus citri TaxID=170843 RepID=UPI0031F8E7AC